MVANPEKTPTWAVMMKAMFGVYLKGEELEIWKYELDQIRNCSDSEVTDAIRFGSTLDRTTYEGKPKLKDVRIWIFMRRKDNRTDNGDEIQGCDHCRKGWMVFAPRLPASFEPDEWHRAVQAEMPCDCDAGQKLKELCQDYKKLKPDEIAALKRAKELAVSQRQAIKRAMDEIV
jgi:hypothetical protein